MTSKHIKTLHRTSKWLTVMLGITTFVIFGYAALTSHPQRVSARIVPSPQKTMRWVFLDQEQIDEGTTIPANTHTVIHLPEGFNRISREVLFGKEGKTTRYWGYCLPQNFDPEVTDRRHGFPGKLFLSEREREVREEEFIKKQKKFSIYNLPKKEDLQKQRPSPNKIRHQIEIFIPNILCYVMSESPLSIGLDKDSDMLNTKLENSIGTDPLSPDTDRDGIWDGIEHFTNISPLIRDTDSDGLIDGLEDKNWDGNVDSGETDPREKDSDRDKLCDGLCRVKLSTGQEILLGEDINLNGMLDRGETDPLLKDTKGDGVSDYAAFFHCQLGVSKYCP
jgi:hypothetical protein